MPLAAILRSVDQKGTASRTTSIYVLAPPTYDWWKHGIKKRVQPRVSITYRRYIRN